MGCFGDAERGERAVLLRRSRIVVGWAACGRVPLRKATEAVPLRLYRSFSQGRFYAVMVRRGEKGQDGLYYPRFGTAAVVCYKPRTFSAANGEHLSSLFLLLKI